MKITTFPLLLSAMVLAALPSAFAKKTVLANRIGPSGAELYIANADGSGPQKLMADTKFDYDASFSPDGAWIVFTSERNGPSNIYRVRPDGSGLERLTDSQGFDDQAALSPNGKQLAFVSTRGAGTTNIWILDLKTKALRNLTGTPELQAAPGKWDGFFRPSWSPDGKWIAFSSDRGTDFKGHIHPNPGWEHVQEASIYVIQPDGKGLKKLTPPGEFGGSPKWSADGKRVLFYSLPAEDSFAARGYGVAESQIVSVDIASGSRMQYTSGPGLKVSPQFVSADRVGYVIKARSGQYNALAFSSGERGAQGMIRNPSWSPDGKRVVYEKFVYASQQNQLLFSKDPSFEVRFSGEFPAISSTGKLAVTPLGEVGAGLSTPHDKVALYVMDADGSNRKELFSREGGGSFAPSWSPDGQWIAFGFGYFFNDREKHPAKLVLVRADGSDARDLTSGTINSGFPSWSPDGKHIVYRDWTAEGQEHGLRILNVPDGTITKLTTENDNFPFWSPAGDLITFTRPGKNQFDIFSIKPDGSDLKQLTDAPGNDAHCAWSPDGKYIVFSSSRLGWRDESPLYDNSPQPYAELFLMNADGSGQRPITDDKWEEGTPAWVPQSVKDQGGKRQELPVYGAKAVPGDATHE